MLGENLRNEQAGVVKYSSTSLQLNLMTLVLHVKLTNGKLEERIEKVIFAIRSIKRSSLNKCSLLLLLFGDDNTSPVDMQSYVKGCLISFSPLQHIVNKTLNASFSLNNLRSFDSTRDM